MGLKVTNNAFGTLNAGINSSATSIVLTAGQGARFPTLSAGDYFYATLIDTSNNLEIVKVTARSTDTMTVVRGQDNTTARAYSTNDRFELRPTAALFNEKANDADVAATYLAKSGGTMTGNLAFGNLTTTSTPTPLNISLGGTYSDTAGANLKLKIWETSTQALGLGVHADTMELIATAANHSIAIRTNGAQRLIANSSGHIRTPAQPTFYAKHNASETPSSGSAFTQWDVITNLGGGTYSSGVYTVPATGVYLITGALLQSNNTAGGVHVKVNGANQLRLFYCGTASGLSYMMGSGEIILSLSSGDTVSLSQENAGVTWYGDSSGLGSFCVRMLG